MRTFGLSLVLFVAVTSATAQLTHHIPFASKQNTIELAIVNTSSIPASDMTIIVAKTPSWLRLEQQEQRIPQVKPETEVLASFNFSVNQTAPISNDDTLSFLVSVSTGEKWSKQISISIDPPEQFKLYQNYPNPFNPTTTLAYELPKEGFVSAKIFNIIGQEVSTIVDGIQKAGYYETLWRASTTASGIYIYQVSYRNDDGSLTVSRKTMTILK